MADSQRKTANLFDISFNRDTDHSTTVYKWTLSGLTPNTSYTCSTNFVQEGSSASIWFGGVDSLNNGVSANNPKTKTSNSSGEIPIYIRHESSTAAYELIDSGDVWLMVNEGSTPLPYEPYGWVHSLRKLGTSTDTITTLPADLYADGQSATVGLKGNMYQASGVSPTTPIQPQETGERTGNLCDIDGFTSGETETKLLQTITLNAGTYTYSCMQKDAMTSNSRNCLMIRIGSAAYTYESTQTNYHLSTGRHSMTFTVPADNTSVELRYWINNFSNACSFDDFMLNTGSTPLPYEPWGVKIPISSASTTTPVYLGETQSTRRIKKLVLTGQETWSRSNSTQVLYTRIDDGLMLANAILSCCSHYPTEESVSSLSNVSTGYSTIRTSGYFVIKDINYSTYSEFQAYLTEQYANGTPVIVWYVLETPETGIVNEPLMKIGDYADTVSGITIPTIAGGDTISVDTTVQPSEVTVNYKGWHNAVVHERNNGAWTE